MTGDETTEQGTDVTKEQATEMTTDLTTEPTTEITSEPTTPVELPDDAPLGAQAAETPAAGREEGQPTERRHADAPSAWGPGPAAGPAQPLPHGPSVPTIVWGLLFALVAAAVITVEVSDVDLNVDVTGPAVLLAAGAALVLWGIAGLGRARRR